MERTGPDRNRAQPTKAGPSHERVSFSAKSQVARSTVRWMDRPDGVPGEGMYYPRGACDITPRHSTLRYIISSHFMSRHVTLCSSRRVTPHHVTSRAHIQTPRLMTMLTILPHAFNQAFRVSQSVVSLGLRSRCAAWHLQFLIFGHGMWPL